MNSLSAQQRAQLFADVDELKAKFKILSERITQLEDSLTTTLRGCNMLIDTDQVITQRIDVANKRLRKLEISVRKLNNRVHP